MPLSTGQGHVIITTMLMSTVFGAQVKKTIDVIYNSVNLTVNGTRINADNILYNGTTYVPLRAVAEALGKDVGWNQDTNTASVNDKGAVVKEEPIKSYEETLSQKNSIRMAKEFLSVMAFSRSGLIKQLEHGGFSNEDATYGVDKTNTDWKKQAVIKAEEFLSVMAFSRSSLIQQLEHGGFSNEDATYAVDEIGL